MNLEDMKKSLEWNCNETNNHHCKVVLELDEDSHGKYLKIFPKHNNKGNIVKENGMDSVLRDVYRYEDEYFVSSVSFENNHIILREN